MRILLKTRFALAAGICLAASPAYALTITDSVGTEAVGGSGISLTLSGMNDTEVPTTDGFIRNDLGWTHTYTPITDTILSATISVDLIDADTGTLRLHAGSDATGTTIGDATGGDQGLPGPWRDLQTPPGPNAGDGSFDNVINIPSSLFADLADGTFAVFGEEIGDLSLWGSNRALLTIEVADPIPEPSTGLLVGMGLLGIGIVGRRKG